MRLSAIALSRVIGIVPTGELNPFGKVFVPSILQPLLEKYKFQKWTQLSEWDPKDPFVLENGYAEECGSIGKLMVYNNGLTIETRSHSADTRAALEGMYEWMARDHGIQYKTGSVNRWLYVTDLYFNSDFDLTAIHPAIKPICEAMTEYNLTLGRPQIDFVLTRFAIDKDHSSLEFPQTPFLVERDRTAAFRDNRYFSESPFPSELHVKLLEKIEKSFLDYARG